MSKYLCKKCCKEFKDIKGMKYHFNNNVCEKKKEYKCKYCDKLYIKYQSYWNHINNACKNRNMIVDLQCKIEDMEDKYSKLKEDSDKIKKIIDTKEKSCNVINNTQNNTIIISNLVKFGSEDISVLTNDEILQSLKMGFYAMKGLINAIHFNDRIPEYQNVCFNSLNSNMCAVYDGTMWSTKNKKEIIEKLINDKIDLIDILSENNCEEFTKLRPHQRETIKTLLSEGLCPNKIKEIEEELGPYIYDKSKQLGIKRKTKHKD